LSRLHGQKEFVGKLIRRRRRRN